MKFLATLLMLLTIGSTFAQTCPTTYCAAAGDGGGLWIQSVDVEVLFNFSGSDYGYGDYGLYSDSSFEQGENYTLVIGPGFSGGSVPVWYKAWIDFNQDGDFADADEEVYNSGSASASFGAGIITIPATAASGNTRLRIMMKANAEPGFCEDGFNGETEDYCVNIGLPAVSCSSTTVPTGLSSAVGASAVTLNWDVVPGSAGCKIMGGPVPNFFGQLLLPTPEVSSAVLPLAGIAPGNYNWNVTCACSLSPLILTQTSATDFFTVPSPRLGYTSTFSLSPNPAISSLNLNYTANTNVDAELRIYDLLGRVLLTKGLSVIAGQNSWQIEIDKLEAGSYLLEFKPEGSQPQVEKLTVASSF